MSDSASPPEATDLQAGPGAGQPVALSGPDGTVDDELDRPREGAPELERRAFVRQMATDTAGLAGRLVGFSRVITRSATAAGQAMISELGALQAAGSDPQADDAGDLRTDATAGAAPMAAEMPGPVGDSSSPQPAPAGPEARPEPPARPARLQVALDAEQVAVLAAATRAIVAVNRAGFAPQLTAATIHWDGEVLRFPTLGWSRRTTQLRADPKIGVLIDDLVTGVFLAVSGTAMIFEAHHARAAMEPLLRRGTDDADEAERRWQALVAEDQDRAVIVVELDQVLTGRR